MKKPKDYIIFPLDVPGQAEAISLVRRLKDHVGMFKVGLELFISEGPQVLRAIREAGGSGIFLDLKLHDIPATVKRAFLAASRHGPEFVTVHCDEGSGTLDEIAKDYPGRTKILAITVLTSLNSLNLLELGYKEEFAENITRLVLLKTRLAQEAGCHGVVCSGHEAAAIRNETGPGFIIVTPGIRPEWSLVGHDDQQRIVTPRMALRNGADYLVVGRPIRDAKDPVQAAEQLVEEIASSL